jgi:hypothetical protein
MANARQILANNKPTLWINLGIFSGLSFLSGMMLVEMWQTENDMWATPAEIDNEIQYWQDLKASHKPQSLD